MQIPSFCLPPPFSFLFPPFFLPQVFCSFLFSFVSLLLITIISLLSHNFPGCYLLQHIPISCPAFVLSTFLPYNFPSVFLIYFLSSASFSSILSLTYCTLISHVSFLPVVWASCKVASQLRTFFYPLDQNFIGMKVLNEKIF